MWPWNFDLDSAEPFTDDVIVLHTLQKLPSPSHMKCPSVALHHFELQKLYFALHCTTEVSENGLVSSKLVKTYTFNTT